MRFVVGLGNPGRRYARSRHNVGFRVLDRVARRDDFRSESRLFQALYRVCGTGAERVFLIKPQAYMNLSGGPTRDILAYFGGDAGDLLVVHDDLDLAAGRLRFRRRGSSGGHRGVTSIIEAIGSEDFPRLKVGIGRDAARDEVDYVLAPLDEAERAVYDEAESIAAQAVLDWLERGLDWCMNRYNG